MTIQLFQKENFEKQPKNQLVIGVLFTGATNESKTIEMMENDLEAEQVILSRYFITSFRLILGR